MKALIVDDEKPNRDGLKLLVEELCPEISQVAVAASAKSARELFNKSPADILFVDINMPIENGFEFLNSVSGNFAVVFVTAYSEFAMRAIKSNAVDYLLKPINTDELVTAVARCKKRLEQNVAQDKTIYDESISNLEKTFSTGSYPEKITLSHMQGFNIISTSDIICIEADGNYSVLHLEGQKKIMVTRKIGEFEFLLDPKIFFRSHKSSIINLLSVKEYSSNEGHIVLLKNGMNMQVSRRKLEDFMTAIDALSKRV